MHLGSGRNENREWDLIIVEGFGDVYDCVDLLFYVVVQRETVIS